MASELGKSFIGELRMFTSYLYGDNHHKKSPTAPFSSTIGAFVIQAVNVHLDLGVFDPLYSSSLGGTVEVVLKKELVGVGNLEVELVEKVQEGAGYVERVVEGSKVIAWTVEESGPVVLSWVSI